MFEDLVRNSDVVIEGMRPGFLAKRGYGFDRLQELNPKIVMCTLSGYGATGPYRDLPEPRHRVRRMGGHAAAGRRRRRVLPHPRPGQHRDRGRPRVRGDGDPRRAGARRAHRRGRVDGARAVGSRAYFDWYRIETWKGYDERSQEEFHGNPTDDYERRAPGLGGMWEGVRYQYYESSDGHILFMASEQAFWKNFCEGIDRMDLFEKWPGKKIADHARGNTELQAILRDIFKTRTTAEWIDVRRRAQHDHRPGEHAADACGTTRSSRTASRGCPTR